MRQRPLGAHKTVRPLRHPDGAKTAVDCARGIAVEIAHTLADRYLSDFGRDDLKEFHKKEIVPINERLAEWNMNVPWR